LSENIAKSGTTVSLTLYKCQCLKKYRHRDRQFYPTLCRCLLLFLLLWRSRPIFYVPRGLSLSVNNVGRYFGDRQRRVLSPMLYPSNFGNLFSGFAIVVDAVSCGRPYWGRSCLMATDLVE